MNKIIVGIGIPGSGKTTVLKKIAEKYGYEYICPDDIRREMLGDTTDQSKNTEIWDEAFARVKDNISQGKTVVFDATFADARYRAKFLDFVRANGAEKIQGVFVDVPLEVAKERNQSRERKVPEFVLENMDRKLKEIPPELSEGFDSIQTLDEFQKLTEVEMKLREKEIHKEFPLR